MKSLIEQPAVLSVHAGSAGQYILRVADARHRDLVVGVTRLLTDATSFVLITPSDIKVFAVGSAPNGNGAAPSPAAADEPESNATLSDETLAAIAAEEGRAVPGDVADGPPTQEVVGETPQGTKVVKRKRPSQVAGHDEQCGRCQGAGKIQMALENGTGAETTCPICKGEGILRRYGNRR